MKANRKFLHGDDEAVSPVIAVILMVAITVVLAATVYVWVSGFGSNSNSSPAHTLSLASAGAITFDTTAEDGHYKTYTVSSADPSLTWGDMKVTVGGIEYAFDGASNCAAGSLDDEQWDACAAGVSKASTDAVNAGDQFILFCAEAADDGNAESPSCLANLDMLILDTEANSVMVTLKLR